MDTGSRCGELLERFTFHLRQAEADFTQAIEWKPHLADAYGQRGFVSLLQDRAQGSGGSTSSGDSMRRLHLFEIEDQAWCPTVIRDCATDYLQHVIAAVNAYEPIAERLS